MEGLEKFPQEPGVYLMKDEEGTVLYVGKAKNLRARVRQYFSGQDTRAQIPYLLAKVESIDTVVVSSEKEALLLENNLIKRHQPQYNIFLKDDKGYISLKITTKSKWPMVQLVRTKGKPPKDGLYFGPYTSTYAARQMLELLIRLFPLRRCTDAELSRRTRPCILYQIKRCVAPCVGMCSKEEYDQIVEQMSAFLRGQDDQVIDQLRQEMEKAAEKLEFERAEELLQTIRRIEHTVEEQRVDQAGGGERDVLGLYRQAGEVSLSQMLFREGKLVGAQNYHFSDVAQEDEPLLTSFLLQQYEEREILPPEIVLPIHVNEHVHELLKTRLHTPLRGDKKKLVAMAQANATAAFHRTKDLKLIRERRLLQLQEELGLNNYPRRIECFDNSQTVSAMVVFTDGEADKSRYRKYKIEATDDYGAMREVLRRRLKKGDLPDLIVIDGGKGHLNVALQVLEELDIVTVDVLGLAKEKGRHDKGLSAEQIFLPGEKLAVELDRHSPTLFLLQQIRDEAHRFAITFQRKRRSKELLTSPLDNVPGIGPVKRKRLLKHFGSAKKVFAATEAELSEIPGLTIKDVQTLLEIGRSL